MLKSRNITKLTLLVIGIMVLSLSGCGGGGAPGGGFSLSLNPMSLSIVQGGSKTTTLEINPTNGFSGRVELSLEDRSGAPAPAGLTLSPASVTVSGAASSQQLTISATNTVPPGNYSLSIKAKSGTVEKKVDLGV